MTSQTPGLDHTAPDGRQVLAALASAIHDSAARLSSIDGATGDGDHGVNMDKGFSLALASAGPGPMSVSDALTTLGTVLLNDIGGAMGPLYGSLFLEMARVAREGSGVTGETFGRMLGSGVAVVREIGGAEVGDKTLLDTLVPALSAYEAALAGGASLPDALATMAAAADSAAESTRLLVARVGRASRLGERSRGFLDAGAVSCAVILGALAGSLAGMLGDETANTQSSHLSTS